MKIIFLFAFIVFLLSGCSSSVRPMFSDTGDVTQEMLAEASATGLEVSEKSMPIAAKAISQAKAFCQMEENELEMNVRNTIRDGDQVPILYLRCVP